MVFRYPYLDPRFLACFSPLLIGLIAAHRFAKPRLRPWWLTILSCLWIIFCLLFAFLLGTGATANFMNPTPLSPDQYVLTFAGGWLFSGLLLAWAPEAPRRLAHL